jgi:hypothetical protein
VEFVTGVQSRSLLNGDEGRMVLGVCVMLVE